MANPNFKRPRKADSPKQVRKDQSAPGSPKGLPEAGSAKVTPTAKKPFAGAGEPQAPLSLSSKEPVEGSGEMAAVEAEQPAAAANDVVGVSPPANLREIKGLTAPSLHQVQSSVRVCPLPTSTLIKYTKPTNQMLPPRLPPPKWKPTSLLKLETSIKPQPLKVVLPPEGVTELVEALSPRSAKASPKEDTIMSPKSLLGSGFVFADGCADPAQTLDGSPKTMTEEQLWNATPQATSSLASFVQPSGSTTTSAPPPKLTANKPLLIEPAPQFQTKPKIAFLSNPLSHQAMLRNKYGVDDEKFARKEEVHVPWKWSAQMLQAGVRPKAPMATTLDWSRTVLEKPKILLSQPTPIEFQALQSLAQMANDMGVGDVEVD
eukprot:g4444.t1